MKLYKECRNSAEGGGGGSGGATGSAASAAAAATSAAAAGRAGREPCRAHTRVAGEMEQMPEPYAWWFIRPGSWFCIPPASLLGDGAVA